LIGYLAWGVNPNVAKVEDAADPRRPFDMLRVKPFDRLRTNPSQRRRCGIIGFPEG